MNLKIKKILYFWFEETPDEKKLNSHTVDEIIKNIENTGKNFDKKIAWEILLVKKLHGKTPVNRTPLSYF